MPPTASNARLHISIGRDSSGAELLTCTSRPRTTRTNRACRAQLNSSVISGSSSPARARSREKWSRSSASATARASPSCSLPSRVSARPARTQRVNARSRASATEESAAASMAAAPGSSTGGSGALGGSGAPRRSRRVMSRSAARSISSSPACTCWRNRATAVGSAVGTPWRSICTAQNVPRSWLRSSSRASCRAGVESLDLGVQLRRRVGAGVEPVALGEEADQRVQRGRDGVAVVLQQRDRAGEPHRQRVRDVGARPVAEPSVDAVLVVQCGRDQRRLHLQAAAAGPRHDVQPQPVPDDRIRLQVVGAEDELHRGTLPAAAPAPTARGSPDR